MKKFDKRLQGQLEEFIKQNGGQRKAAEILGYSDAVISTYRSSKYTGDVEKVENRLREIFDNKSAAETLHQGGVFTPDYVKTSISSGVYDTIRICHLKGGLAIECGDAGIGKTKAAKQYLKDYPNSSIYVTVNPCLVTIPSF